MQKYLIVLNRFLNTFWVECVVSFLQFTSLSLFFSLCLFLAGGIWLVVLFSDLMLVMVIYFEETDVLWPKEIKQQKIYF